MVFIRHRSRKAKQAIKQLNQASVDAKYPLQSQKSNGELQQELAACQRSKTELETFLNSLVAFLPTPIVVTNIENNQILLQNQWFNLCFGITNDKPNSNSGIDIYVNPLDYEEAIAKLKDGGALKNTEFLLKRLNGENFEALVSAETIRYAGQPAVLWTLTDILEQKQSHVLPDATDPKQSEARLYLLERAIAASRNGIVLTDANQPDNPIIYANPAFETITGYTREEVMGRNCRFLHGNDKDQPALDELRMALRQQKECHVTLQNYRKDGAPFCNELYVAPVFDAEGNLTHFIGIQTDITERKRAEIALREQEEQYRRIVETATEGIWVLDQNSETSFVNQQMANMLGYTADEMLGKTLFAYMDEEGVKIANTNLKRRQEGIHETHDFKFLRQDGTDLWAIVSTAPFFGQDGQYAGVLGMITDITDRKRAESALRQSEQRLDSILGSLQDVVWSVSATTFEMLYLNMAAEKIYGRPVVDFFTNPNLWLEVVHADDLDRVSATAQSIWELGSKESEYRIVRPDGSVRWLHDRGHITYDTDGIAVRLDGIATDITERKRMEEQLIHDALHDALTGLPNRALFMDRLRQAISRARHCSNDLFAVLFLDLDRFKVINDSLGHMIGDQLLVAIAQRLDNCLRLDDTIARLGGDEFAILLHQIETSDHATEITERIHQALKLPFNLSGHEVFTSASIGVALSSPAYNYPEELLRDADTATYQAKEQGRACHAVFDRAMYDRAVALLQLETDLRWAVQRQELRVYYQPIISLVTGRITGFESLVRWQHPERGLLSPADFISVAEETGLIVAIDQWVLSESCYQLSHWQSQFPDYLQLTISVNLSSRQFSQPNLIQYIQQILQQTRIDSSRLRLEITESAIMNHPQNTATILHQLRDLGIKLSLDDFGTGYSSLSYLHRFPINTLKIDQSFVHQIDQEDEQLAIVRAIVTLASNLGMDVVAEGVETVNQLSQLKNLQCEYGQGFLFSEALNSEMAGLLMASSPQW